MNDRTKTVAAVVILVGFVVVILLVIGVLASSRKVVSPIPTDGAIKIIFVSPTDIPTVTATITPVSVKK